MVKLDYNSKERRKKGKTLQKTLFFVVVDSPPLPLDLSDSKPLYLFTILSLGNLIKIIQSNIKDLEKSLKS